MPRPGVKKPAPSTSEFEPIAESEELDCEAPSDACACGPQAKVDEFIRIPANIFETIARGFQLPSPDWIPLDAWTTALKTGIGLGLLTLR